MVSEAMRIGPGSRNPQELPGILVSETRRTHRKLCTAHLCCQVFGVATEVNR
ncbi:hypothetical protein ADIAG_02915 [Paeniglutamicibacter gangotriensis Lz1y]|uniref:Uncharacterized protein n=1 Tax=Paeniglutamicibacter gangotriensis Lz1y TaxID=1276920 RepID=M7MRG6_9MICC|nr:hypothetical protein ADIAG_02915 [Paeniglutamicibacter gangotriensis Lz1y]